MEETLRLFVAAALPAEVKDYLVQARDQYQDPNSRSVPEQNLHLTLYFIGNVPAFEEETNKQKIAEVAKRHQPFTLALEQLEPGPKPKSPRLIWARFRQHEAFTQLSQELTEALSSETSKQKEFIPHVTVARFKKEVRVRHNLSVVSPPEEILFPVSSIALWQSKLASPHPVYSVVEEFSLG
ncbi:RNA 2',3'-cyclic phosphodiesterase [Rufibacter roseus]|uniref:RNA 2',3'-cyclic phosphodiesterase n=1 Tax=Rufibacter roseus TaxID=1567108 RepID=A0ABW2DSG0_9BACT|nr:RNA 2',3'-cyclic phosphodiesterase [Rufibacter roseus]